jgi:hypothetical protein
MVGTGSQNSATGRQANSLRKFCRKSKVWLLLLRLAAAKVTDHMVHISEELKAAKAARAAISVLLKATPKSAVLATLGKANNAAILNLSSGGALNEARAKVGIALSNLIHEHGPTTPLSIDRAKFAIDVWIRELEASPAA